jgi:hypothetical protein
VSHALKFGDTHGGAEVLDRLIETVANQPPKPKWTFTQWALLAVLVIIVGTWLLGLYFNIFGKEIKRIDIWDVQIVGPSALCPGENLTISFNLYADGTGKLVESGTVWIEVPPKTAIYSEERTLLVDGLLEQEQTIAWEVPQTFINPSNLEEAPLPPGPYRRIFAISSATDEDVFALDRVSFTIRSDC